ncbi:MAG: ATP-dependent Clp protease adapter ClpS [Desulfobacterales bacterium]
MGTGSGVSLFGKHSDTWFKGLAMENDSTNGYGPDLEEEIISEIRDEIDEPSMYKVLLHNDDYTTMEFVVEILMLVFKKSPEEAVEIMLNVHQKGIGVCGVYPYEVSETKVKTVDALARENGFPLKCTMEKE